MIDILEGVPLFVNFNNIGESYTPYVQFVLKLRLNHIIFCNMVIFFTILSLVRHFQKSIDLTLSKLHY